jgi:hypothetical protein
MQSTYTRLGRSFSLRHPSHRRLLGLVVLAALLAGVFPQGRAPLGAMAQTGLTVFLLWGLLRELAPDHPGLALWGAAGGGATAIVTGATTAAALAGLMLAARIVARSTGAAPLLTDIVAVGAFVTVFARSPLAWASGLAVAAAVALDTCLPRPAPRRHLWLAAIVAAAATTTAGLSGAMRWDAPNGVTLALMAAALAAAIVLRPAVPVTPDDRGGTWSPGRLAAARQVTVGALALAAFAGGATASPATWPAWLAALLAGLSSWRSRR